MNRVILIGNLATDPEGRRTESGLSRSTFRLAVQRSYANANGVREADFFSVVAWRGTADFCNKYLHKGSKIAVEGRIATRSYDGQDGVRHYVTEIIADSVEGLGRRDAGDPGPEEPAAKKNEEYQEVDDEEIPFEG